MGIGDRSSSKIYKSNTAKLASGIMKTNDLHIGEPHYTAASNAKIAEDMSKARAALAAKRALQRAGKE